MEATQSYPNLLSEKQAAKRLGVARITLLRAREAGRIRFYRIGTRVLYCTEQLTEFLYACERNGKRNRSSEREHQSVGVPKENNITFEGARVNRRGSPVKSDLRKKEQATLPFTRSRP